MRPPWIQVDTDFIAATAKDLGSHLGMSRREALGLALDLWTWALARSPDTAAPDGLVTGTGAVPDRLLAGAVEWTGPVEQLISGLEGSGLLERVDGGYRLRGISRYKSTWEKNRRRSTTEPERNRSGTGGQAPRKMKTEMKIEEKKKIPPAPQGAREPREGDPCKEHFPPRTVPAAAQVALDSFAPEPPKPKPGEWTLHAAVQVVYELVRHGQRYPWDPQREQKALESLWGLCAAEGIREPQAQVQEVAKRLGRALACADEPVGKPPFGRRASTLAELAKPACWSANATPFEFQEECVEGGLRKMRSRRLEVWPHAKWRAAA